MEKTPQKTPSPLPLRRVIAPRHRIIAPRPAPYGITAPGNCITAPARMTSQGCLTPPSTTPPFCGGDITLLSWPPHVTSQPPT